MKYGYKRYKIPIQTFKNLDTLIAHSNVFNETKLSANKNNLKGTLIQARYQYMYSSK